MAASSAPSARLPGDGSDGEEEEQLVMVELAGVIDSDMLEKCENKCKIVGINTEKPFLQVDNYVFAGEYEDALGTCVIFEETSDQVDGDNTKPQLKYKCHTVKKLNMMRTFLTEKKEGDEGGGKVEWFQIKDDSVANWTSMICSIAREGEDPEDESQSEAEELEGAAEDSGHLDQSFELEKQDSEMDEPTSHDVCPALEEEELEALTLADKAPAADQETPAAMTEASETGS